MIFTDHLSSSLFSQSSANFKQTCCRQKQSSKYLVVGWLDPVLDAFPELKHVMGGEEQLWLGWVLHPEICGSLVLGCCVSLNGVCAHDVFKHLAGDWCQGDGTVVSCFRTTSLLEDRNNPYLLPLGGNFSCINWHLEERRARGCQCYFRWECLQHSRLDFLSKSEAFLWFRACSSFSIPGGSAAKSSAESLGWYLRVILHEYIDLNYELRISALEGGGVWVQSSFA